MSPEAREKIMLEVMKRWGKVLQAIINCRSMFKSCGCFNLDSNISSNSPAMIKLSDLTLHLMFTMIFLVKGSEIVVVCPNSVFSNIFNGEVSHQFFNSPSHTSSMRCLLTTYGMTAITSDLPELKSFYGSQLVPLWFPCIEDNSV